MARHKDRVEVRAGTDVSRGFRKREGFGFSL